MNVHIRWMIRRDMTEVLEIENKSSEHPWTETNFIHQLRQRNCIGMIAESEDEKVVGYMIYELHKDKLIVLNFAVHPDHQRKGVGRQMIEKLTSKLSYQRRNGIQLAVRETNVVACNFLTKMDFQYTQTLVDAYDDVDEDAYIFEYRHGAECSATLYDKLFHDTDMLDKQPTNRVAKLFE